MDAFPEKRCWDLSSLHGAGESCSPALTASFEEMRRFDRYPAKQKNEDLNMTSKGSAVTGAREPCTRERLIGRRGPAGITQRLGLFTPPVFRQTPPPALGLVDMVPPSAL
ncbi:hypothetical protein MHYP_G00198020 [Metynnis hypsauchen]